MPQIKNEILEAIDEVLVYYNQTEERGYADLLSVVCELLEAAKVIVNGIETDDEARFEELVIAVVDIYNEKIKPIDWSIPDIIENIVENLINYDTVKAVLLKVKGIV
jgi:hypothetical protein